MTEMTINNYMEIRPQRRGGEFLSASMQFFVDVSGGRVSASGIYFMPVRHIVALVPYSLPEK